MGASLGGSRNGGGSRWRGVKSAPMSEINVTPMVDVMLVLLIIFMIAAPLLTVGVSVDLPQAKAPPLSGDQEPLTVTIDKDGQIYLQDTEVDIEELVPRLTAIAESGFDERIYVRGDQAVDYGTVVQVMATMNRAGFAHIAMVSEAPGGS
jgi:biopolymer transport protein TolR